MPRWTNFVKLIILTARVPISTQRVLFKHLPLVAIWMNPQTCYDYTNKCGSQSHACVSYHYELELQDQISQQNLRRRIYEQTSPYYERVIYTGYAGSGSEITSCNIEFNGVQCQSCQVIPQLIESQLEDGTTVSVSWPCYEFDCSNTAGQHKGNTCSQDGSKVFNHLTYTGCAKCNICEDVAGMAFVTLRDATVDIYGYSYSCDELDTLGVNGRLSEGECDVIQHYAAFDCGCSAV